jgi:hypothetical protein
MSRQSDVEQRYAAVIEALSSVPGASYEASGARRRSFGAGALKVDGKIFAMVSSQGRFVVKLPRQRVEALTTSGDGTPYDPGHGRVMREWLSIEPSSSLDWIELAREAFEFVRPKH